MKSLRSIKEKYLDTLSNRYSTNEINTIFFILAEIYLHKVKMQIQLSLDELVDESELKSILFENALYQLAEGVPYQYVTGSALFFGCEIMVNKHVLIPRPETEELVEWIINDIEDKSKKIRIMDLCTGSGCIPIALAKNILVADISALEISTEAIELAEKNADLNKVNIDYFNANLFNTESIDFKGKFDIIVSNPPYIKESEKQNMEENVLKYEPSQALFVSDSTPLIFYKEIINFAGKHLNQNGSVYVEINQELGEETLKLFTEKFSQVELKQDLSGNFRMIKARGYN